MDYNSKRQVIFDEVEAIRRSNNKRATMRKLKAFIVIVVVFVAVTAIAGMIRGNIAEGIVIAIVPTFFAITISIKVNGSAQNPDDAGVALNFKNKIVNCELANAFGDIEYEPYGHLPESLVRSLRVIPGFDRMSGNDLIKGIRNDIPFTCSNIRVESKVTKKDEDGKLKTAYEGRFWGIVAQIECPKPHVARVLLYTKGFPYIMGADAPTPFERLLGKSFENDVELESIDFNSQYELVSDDQIYARQIFTPHRMEAFMDLDNSHLKYFALLFVDQYMYAFILEHERFEIKLKGDSIKNQADLVAQQAEGLAKIIDKLIAVGM